MRKRKKLKIIVASGKGGVGKSMLTSSLAILFGREKKIIAVDCDADAPNLDIWLGEVGRWQKMKKVSVSERPAIDNSKLNQEEAGECAKKCKFGALYIKNGKLKLNPFLCEGCGACQMFCPKGVIKMKPVKNAEIKIKRTKYSFPLISGQLFPGQTGSGKVVDRIKAEAEKFSYDLMIIDSAPGTGCPVTAALRDADFVVLVTEPTISGVSDLKRVLNLVNYFSLPYGIVVNKWDIDVNWVNRIRQIAPRNFLGKISYDKRILQSAANLIPIMETDLKAREEITRIYHRLTADFKLFSSLYNVK